MPVDGQLRSATEIHNKTAGPRDSEAFVFKANGKQYNVVVYFEYGGQTYEVYEDGKKLGERRPNVEHYFDLAQRICEELSGTSLRRL